MRLYSRTDLAAQLLQAEAKPRSRGYYNKHKRNAAISSATNQHKGKHVYRAMIETARELHSHTGCFEILESRRNAITGRQNSLVVDFAAAPGGLLKATVEHDHSLRVIGYHLPLDEGGWAETLLPKKWLGSGDSKMPHMDIRALNIAMLSEDMGTPLGAISPDHPLFSRFLPRAIPEDLLADLVIADGLISQSSRDMLEQESKDSSPHDILRAEARVASVQLALGLEHLRPGGMMIFLPQCFHTWDTVSLIQLFHKLSGGAVKVYKSSGSHRKLSSFHMVATNVESQCQAAREAIAEWKKLWHVATFGTPKELLALSTPKIQHVHSLLDWFVETLTSLGIQVWQVQADAIASAPFMQK